jgi:hypothetical protein
VDCWIGVGQSGTRRVVRLAGRLTSAHVPELLKACNGSHELDLDLSELLSADVAGLDAIRRIHHNGASLIRPSGYIQFQLDSAPDHPALGG